MRKNQSARRPRRGDAHQHVTIVYRRPRPPVDDQDLMTSDDWAIERSRIERLTNGERERYRTGPTR